MSIFRRTPPPTFKIVATEHKCALPKPSPELLGSTIQLDECGHRWECYDNWAGGPDWLPDRNYRRKGSR